MEVRFRSWADWARCCESAQTASTFGVRLARRLELRLQQLTAMESLEDIVLLPCHVDIRGGRWVVAVDDETSVVLSLAGAAQAAGDRSSDILVVEEIVQDGSRR